VNGLKTALLLGLLSSIVVVGGAAAAGRRGVWIGLAIAVAMNFFSYFFSEKMALSAHNAQPLTAETNPRLYAQIHPMVQRLCQRMGIPEPKLWTLPDPSPNAFATGRDPNHASVAFTEGLLELMDRDEVEGVLAHELAHIKHRDILISSIAATVGAAITAIAHIGYFFGGSGSDDEDRGNPMVSMLLLFLGPMAAGIIQMAISRTREFSADRGAADACGTPNGLISGLAKLEGYSKRIPMDVNPAQSHMFIIKPFSGASLANLFSTHPATGDRIEALRNWKPSLS
jgi:heat shock protein HtpX